MSEKNEKGDNQEQTALGEACLRAELLEGARLLVDMAQVQRRNAELAMGVYTWLQDGGKHERGQPAFPEELRKTALERIDDAFRSLKKIDGALDKLL